MTNFLNVSLIILSLGLSLSSLETRANEIKDLNRELYGKNISNPSPESLIGKYLTETGAHSFMRSFSGIDGSTGPARLVIFVSEKSFPVFKKYFDNSQFLYQFHEPHQHVFNVAYEGHRGTMGRLRDEFRYTYAGVLAIPILLTKAEGARAEKFFNLALKIPRKNDVALFPWRLTDQSGLAYCKSRTEKSLADWFIHMPIGKTSKKQKFNAYDVCSIKSEEAQLEIQNVWCAPEGNRTLSDILHTDFFDGQCESISPGRIGQALLGSASRARVPVVFRFADDHVNPRKDDQITPVPQDFDTYFDLEFNPSTGGEK